MIRVPLQAEAVAMEGGHTQDIVERRSQSG